MVVKRKKEKEISVEQKIQEAAELILMESNIDFDEWKNQIISKKKLQILEGKDKEWELQVLQKELLNVVLEGCKTNASQPSVTGGPDSHNP